MDSRSSIPLRILIKVCTLISLILLEISILFLESCFLFLLAYIPCLYFAEFHLVIVFVLLNCRIICLADVSGLSCCMLEKHVANYFWVSGNLVLYQLGEGSASNWKNSCQNLRGLFGVTDICTIAWFPPRLFIFTL